MSSIDSSNRFTGHPIKNIKNITQTIALIWAILQLWSSSPLQYFLSEKLHINFIIENIQMKFLHLSFAIFLVFIIGNQNKKATNASILFDCSFAFLGFCTVIYKYIFYEQIALRPGLPNTVDIVISCLGLFFLLTAAYKTLGFAMIIIATIFLFYSLYGSIMPHIIAHKGYSISSVACYQWLSDNGVFGIPLSVTADFVFLFVLFGCLLEKAGAGKFFIKLAFAAFSKFHGGAAKASIIASGLMGMISGSSIATTISVGTLTIPLMKKSGISAEKAGAIQVSSGITGQIMPPVMGAAAFLMSEFLSISYAKVMQHALIPALIIYITLMYIVHIESMKLGIKPSTQQKTKTKLHISILSSIAVACFTFCFVYLIYAIINGISYHSIHIQGIKELCGKYSSFAIISIIILSYICIIYFQTKNQQVEYIEETCQDENLEQKMQISEILKSGMHYIIPITILIWNLLVEHMSTSFSVFWAILSLIFILLTEHSIKYIITKQYAKIANCIKKDFSKLINCFIGASNDMLTVSIATSTAGIIVGAVSQTGIGLIITDVVDYISGGNLYLTLVATAIICIILGMGIPTTTCYIIVSSIMAPVINNVMIQNGIHTPMIAIHLFVFYFGLMADVTPPVGIAAYAAAAIAKSKPLKTAVQGFIYDARTMILPFIFIFNQNIILYNITRPFIAIIDIINATLGIIIFSSGTQGYFISKNKMHENALLIFASIAILCPTLIINLYQKEFNKIDKFLIHQKYYNIEKNKFAKIKIWFEGYNDMNDIRPMIAIIKPTKSDTIKNILNDHGIDVIYQNTKIIVNQTQPTTTTKINKGIIPSTVITDIGIAAKQPPKFIIIIIGLLTTAWVFITQKKRSNMQNASQPTPTNTY